MINCENQKFGKLKENCYKIPTTYFCPIKGPVGPTGPPGMNGVPGATGPAGEAGPGSTLSGIQTQMKVPGFNTIEDNAPVIFNDILFDKSDAITYNPLTGEFTINQPGVYYFNFSVAVDGAGFASSINFELSGSDGTSVYMSSPIVSDLLSGNALVEVNTVPTTFSLINRSGDQAFFVQLETQANMTILHLM